MITKLLATFSSKNDMETTISKVKNNYVVAYSKIYVLEHKENSRELILTYNIEPALDVLLENTIQINRNKRTNTLYTINALNAVIRLNNDGVLDSNFLVNWDEYKHTFLVTDDDGLKIIPTKLFAIVDL